MRKTLFRNMKGTRRGAWQCALICFFSALVSIVPFALLRDGYFHVWSDFNTQQVPFGIALHNSISNLNLGGWSWNYGIGMSTIQAFSFYALGSPFYLLSLPFPASWYPYLMPWIYVLKYMVAGITAYHYIRRFTEKDVSAIAGAVMYAFSGFQATNLMFYHFHDVVALFPLMLIGLERILKDPKDRKLFIFAVFINALTNYFFFAIEAVFTVLYFLFRSFPMTKNERKISTILKNAINCFGCALWGIAMAAILFLPNVLYMLSTPRMQPNFYFSKLTRESKWILHILRGLLLPADTMRPLSSVYFEEYSSVAAYLPFAGMALCFAYLRKEKDGLSRLLRCLLVISFFPLLSSGFLLFTENTMRWWFALTLMMSLASAKVIDHAETYDIRRGTIIYALSITVLCLVIAFVPYDQNTPSMLSDPKKLLLFAGIALAGAGLAWFLLGREKKHTKAVLSLACTFAVITTALTLYLYWSGWDPNGDGHDRKRVELGEKLETINDQYRYDLTANQLSMPGGGSGLYLFSSTISKGEREFDSLYGFFSNNQSLDKTGVRGLPELFSAKYVLKQDADPEEEIIAQEIFSNGQTWYVTENEVNPIGFAVNQYILKDDLLQYDDSTKGIILLQAAVIAPEDEEAVSKVCSRFNPEEADLTESPMYYLTTDSTVTDFHRDNTGFRCKSHFEDKQMVYFSVSNEGGWTATIDGEKQPIIPSAGMMLLSVPEGEHEITFTYRTPGYDTGKIISIAAILLFVLYVTIDMVRKRRNP